MASYLTTPTSHAQLYTVWQASIADTYSSRGTCQRALWSIKLCTQGLARSNLPDSILGNGNLKYTYVSSELAK